MNTNDVKVQSEPIFRKFGITFAGVFGSVARGQARADSDVDLLVQFGHSPSLVQLIQFENELKDTLHTDVDVVIRGSEKPLIKADLQKDLVTIYDQG